MKQFTVTFEFDQETETVSNIKTFVDGVEKKKKTTKQTKSKEVILEESSIITLTDNKLEFNNKAVAEMGISHETRVVIKYEKFGPKNMIPIIGTDESFDEEGAGNKLTKTNTVAFKGKQNTVLKEYGAEFTLEAYKDGIWKLVSLGGAVISSSAESYEKAVEKAEVIPTDLFTEEDEDTEIDEMEFTL